MSRRPARFTEADIYRAIRAAERAGGNMAVEIAPGGTIRIVPTRGLGADLESAGLERELAEHRAKHDNG